MQSTLCSVHNYFVSTNKALRFASFIDIGKKCDSNNNEAVKDDNKVHVMPAVLLPFSLRGEKLWSKGVFHREE